jgi:single-strand DNA-binding protein
MNGGKMSKIYKALEKAEKERGEELKEETCFITAVVWDRQAETCNQYLHKGSPVFIEGRLQSRSWEDNSGQKRNVIEVRAERVQFLGAPATPKASASAEEPVPETSTEPPTETSWLAESEDESHEN